MTATSPDGASWQRLAGQRSNTIAGFGLFTLEGALSFVIVAPMPGQPVSDRLHRQLRVWTTRESGSPPARDQALGQVSGAPDRQRACSSLRTTARSFLPSRKTSSIQARLWDNSPGFGWSAVKGAASVAPGGARPVAACTRLAGLDQGVEHVGLSPCEEWLFDPRVHEGVLGATALTFGTVDGQTAIFAYAPASGAVQPLSVVPRAVNAVVLPTTGGARRLPSPSRRGLVRVLRLAILLGRADPLHFHSVR